METTHAHNNQNTELGGGGLNRAKFQIDTTSTHSDQNSFTSVLHVGDAAAVSSVLAKFQRKLGMKADVVSLPEEDPYGYVKFYGYNIKVNQSGLLRILATIINKWRSRTKSKSIKRNNIEPWNDLMPYEAFENKLLFRMGLHRGWYLQKIMTLATSYDIIHLHFYPQFAPYIKSKFPQKKIVIHHHGTGLRNATPAYRKIQEKYEESADLVLVSTEDLLNHMNIAGVYLPNPCDTDIFYPSEIPPENNKILRIKNPHVSDVWADSTHKKLDLNMPYVVLERNLQYENMRNILCGYTHYIDWTPGYYTQRHLYSVLGLQALACGLTVLGCDYKMHSGKLPSEHQPNNVVRSLNQLYRRRDNCS